MTTDQQLKTAYNGLSNRDTDLLLLQRSFAEGFIRPLAQRWLTLAGLSLPSTGSPTPPAGTRGEKFEAEARAPTPHTRLAPK